MSRADETYKLSYYITYLLRSSLVSKAIDTCNNHVGSRAGRYLVLLAVTAIFLAIFGISIQKFRKRSIGETQSTKKASEMVFPSFVLCPFFNSNYSANETTKNLTEYYFNRSSIKNSVVSIHQQYITEDGLVF